MSDAAPPPWVRKLSKQVHGVDAGLKVLLITAWGFGPYQRQGPIEVDGGRMPSAPVVIYPCAETLAEESGQPLGTVKDQLRRAARLGWIRRDAGSKFTLAWREPGCFEYGERPAGRPSRTVDQPDGGPTMPTGAPTCPDGGPTSGRTARRPLTFQGTSNSTSSDLAAAHTTPSESTTPLPAAYPEHVRAKHAQVTQSSHVAPPGNSNGSPAGGHSPGEPSFADRIDAACAAASIAHSNTATSAHSAAWTPAMVAAMAEFDDPEDDVIRVLEAWQAAPRTERPAMGSLWHAWGRSPGFWFVEQVLGTGSAPAKREALSDARAPGESEDVFAALDRRREAEAAEYAASMAGGAA